jgi:hypothetical protein
MRGNVLPFPAEVRARVMLEQRVRSTDPNLAFAMRMRAVSPGRMLFAAWNPRPVKQE